MIVRYESDGSIIMITQNDHAQLSGLFAAHWGNDTFEKPRPYASLVRAAMFHDRGWIRYETGPQLNPETGKTPNYREVPNDRMQLEAFEWAGDWLSAIDPYAGVMITKHRSGLWQGRYGVITHPPAIQRGTLPPDIQTFIAKSEAKQKVAADKLDAKEIAINYNLLQVWDMMSLYICSTEVLKPDRIEPVPVAYSGAAGVGMTLTPATIKRDRARSLSVRSAFADDQRHLPPVAADQVQGLGRVANALFQDRAADRVIHTGAARAELEAFSDEIDAQRRRILGAFPSPRNPGSPGLRIIVRKSG